MDEARLAGEQLRECRFLALLIKERKAPLRDADVNKNDLEDLEESRGWLKQWGRYRCSLIEICEDQQVDLKRSRSDRGVPFLLTKS